MVKHYRYDTQLGKCVEFFEEEKEFVSPHVIHDMEPYQSPIDGRVISGRAARREDLKRSGCVPWEKPVM